MPNLTDPVPGGAGWDPPSKFGEGGWITSGWPVLFLSQEGGAA